MRLFIIASILLVISCNKEQPELYLLNPQNEYEGRLDSVAFEWMSNEGGTKNLIVSDDYNFQNILLDTIINKDSFIAVKFSPDKEYYWKVKTKELDSDTRFETIDPLLDISPDYEVEILRLRFENTSNIWDSLRYKDTVSFMRENGRLRIQLGGGYIDRWCNYYRYYLGRYIYDYPSGSNGTSIYLDRVNQEIEIYSRVGGIGSGTIYRARFKY